MTEARAVSLSAEEKSRTELIERQNWQAMELIQSTLEDRDNLSTGNCKTAYEMLVVLQSNYQGLDKHARTNAHQKFFSLNPYSYGDNLIDYLGRFEQLLST